VGTWNKLKDLLRGGKMKDFLPGFRPAQYTVAVLNPYKIAQTGGSKVLLILLALLITGAAIGLPMLCRVADDLIATKLCRTISAQARVPDANPDQDIFNMALRGLEISLKKSVPLREVNIEIPVIRSLLYKLGFRNFCPSTEKITELNLTSTRVLEGLSGQKLGNDPETWKKWFKSRDDEIVTPE